MRILYVISSLAKCGPVNVLFDIVHPLARDNDIVIATLRAEEENSRASEFVEVGAKVVCLTKTRLDYVLRGRKRFRRLVNAFHPDVVHSHGYRSDALCSRLKVPVVTTVHNNIYEDFRDTYGPIVGRFMEKSQVMALKSIRYVVACSQSNADYLLSEYRLKALAIRNGVDQERFASVTPRIKSRLRSNLNVNANAYILISTGGCSERKRTLELISAFNRVLAKDYFELYILGGGPQLDECRRIAGERVHVLGAQPNVVEYLRASDLFVSMSSSEGMPLAVLEAVSCGLPLMLSDIGPHKEIAAAIGESGSCEIVGLSAHELETALARLLEDSNVRRGTGEIVQFSSANMAAEYLGLYRDIAD